MIKMMNIKRYIRLSTTNRIHSTAMFFNSRKFSNQEKGWRNLPKFSIEEFLQDKTNYELSNELADIYIAKATSHSLIAFHTT